MIANDFIILEIQTLFLKMQDYTGSMLRCRQESKFLWQCSFSLAGNKVCSLPSTLAHRRKHTDCAALTHTSILSWGLPTAQRLESKFRFPLLVLAHGKRHRWLRPPSKDNSAVAAWQSADAGPGKHRRDLESGGATQAAAIAALVERRRPLVQKGLLCF